MSVAINFKICDKAKECGGIAVCPTKALSWSEEKETIVIDNDKCISCGLCENECPIGAIRVAKAKEEYERIKEEIEKDSRTTKDLFVDRYGAAPLSEFFMIDANEMREKIKKDELVLVEFYNDDSIQCLLKSIPIKELTSDLPKETLFYKVEANESSMAEYQVKELPSLLVFKNGNLIGCIDGYFTNDRKKEISSRLNDIIKNS